MKENTTKLQGQAASHPTREVQRLRRRRRASSRKSIVGSRVSTRQTYTRHAIGSRVMIRVRIVCAPGRNTLRIQMRMNCGILCSIHEWTVEQVSEHRSSRLDADVGGCVFEQGQSLR
jgi:hypothetical protein